MPRFTGALVQPTLRSLVLSHLCLEATIHVHLILIQNLQADTCFSPSVSYEYKGTYFNSLDRAMTLPCDEIVDSLLRKDCPVSYKAKLTALQTRDLQALIESGDFTKFNHFLQFLFKSDRVSGSSPPFFGIDDQSYMQDVRRHKHNAIFTAASLGFCYHLKMILQHQSASAYAEDIIERNIAFLAAINSSQPHTVSWLVFSDIHRDSFYWLEPMPSEVYDQGSKSMSLLKYAIHLQEISEEFRQFVIDATAVAQNKPEQVTLFGGRKYFNQRYECLASDLPDLPREVEEYIWPHSHDHEKPKATVPLIWAVIYNRPKIVEALLSEPLPSYDDDVIEAATTCAIMMDFAKIVMLFELVHTL
ncbi:uncharacterized protein EAE97_011379 [Botrytis byssoidea]|uniref:Uncharacterized protein n=1 Tax=Botrytis byssoidea TaxID=139641 RepID=A0A9P5HRW8_9HELO|nr:uncharacterized protein EAE97_011379 [Botrytis byssoidea]KAF7921111.1 hypothetical protein EAE97_011379 [Botrytis byssoidea]